MAAAALEANANEVIQDGLDGKVRTDLMTEAKKVRLDDLLQDKSGDALKRYRGLALLACSSYASTLLQLTGAVRKVLDLRGCWTGTLSLGAIALAVVERIHANDFVFPRWHLSLRSMTLRRPTHAFLISGLMSPISGVAAAARAAML
jgi:hypothetical protein